MMGYHEMRPGVLVVDSAGRQGAIASVRYERKPGNMPSELKAAVVVVQWFRDSGKRSETMTAERAIGLSVYLPLVWVCVYAYATRPGSADKPQRVLISAEQFASESVARQAYTSTLATENAQAALAQRKPSLVVIESTRGGLLEAQPALPPPDVACLPRAK